MLVADDDEFLIEDQDAERRRVERDNLAPETNATADWGAHLLDATDEPLDDRDWSLLPLATKVITTLQTTGTEAASAQLLVLKQRIQKLRKCAQVAMANEAEEQAIHALRAHAHQTGRKRRSTFGAAKGIE